MPNEIAVTVLDLDYDNTNKYAWYKLPPLQKLKRIEAYIMSICEIMKSKHPDAMWVVLWREYGIKTNDYKITVDDEFKKIFKHRLQALSKIHLNLVIIAGTIAARKKIAANDCETQKQVVQKIMGHYVPHQWLWNQEILLRSEILNEEQQKTNPAKFTKEMLKILQIMQKLDTGKPLTAWRESKRLHVIRNTCYIFTNGEVLRRNKSAPFDETDKSLLRHSVFQPGKFTNNNNTASPFITLVHPVTSEKIVFAVEICYENTLHYVKKYLECNPHLNPVIHFILSDSLKLTFGNLSDSESIVIQADSLNPTKFVCLSREAAANNDISLYVMNPFNTDTPASLVKLPPLYPFVLRLIAMVEPIFNICESSNDESLQSINNDVLELYSACCEDHVNNNKVYTCLETLINTINNAHKKNTIKADTSKPLSDSNQPQNDVAKTINDFLIPLANQLQTELTQERKTYPESGFDDMNIPNKSAKK